MGVFMVHVNALMAPRKRPIRLQLLLPGDIPAVLPDARQDHARHPVLKLPGLRLVGAHGELVEARLGDEGGGAPGGSQEQFLACRALLIGVKGKQHLVGSPGHVQPQRPTNIRRDEPGLAVDLHDADGIVPTGRVSGVSPKQFLAYRQSVCRLGAHRAEGRGRAFVRAEGV